MKKLKNILLLILVMSFTSTVVNAHDIEVKNADGVTIYYNYIKNSACIEVTYKGSYASEYSNEYSGDIKIPETVTYDGFTYTVVHIGDGTFKDCKNLTSINIPDGVTSISSSAFYGCSCLTSINIPNSITSISSSTFFDCTGLTSITINSNSIMSKTYTSSFNLETIFGSQVKSYTIGNEVTQIGEYAFYKYSSLTSIEIPNSVTSIGEDAFARCTGLTSVTIPNSVTSISKYTFYGCTSLTSVIIPNSVSSIGESAFAGCTKLTSITIPNSVTSIDKYAFQNCSSLTSIEIPNSVTTIGFYAFNGCPMLTSVIINSNSIMSKTTSSSNLKTIFGSQVESYTIGNEVTQIGECAFDDYSSLTSIEIPNSVTTIGKYAFQNCNRLTSIGIPNSITSIDEYTFSDCSGLTSIEIPNSVTTIGRGAFRNCSRITSINIPDNVETIGLNAFAGCTRLAKVIIDNLSSWCNISFEDAFANPLYNAKHLYLDEKTEITKVIIPNNITSIGQYQFYNGTNITSVEIPSRINSIGKYAFYGCNSIKNVSIDSNDLLSKTYSATSNLSTIFGKQIESCIIGENVSNISNYAFSNCDKLSMVTINNKHVISKTYTTSYNLATIFGVQVKQYKLGTTIDAIGDYTFYNCTAMESLIMPNHVTKIGDSAFYNCSGLQSINIPSSITSIGGDAFDGCTSLTKVIAGDVSTWCNITFKTASSNPLYYAKHLYSNKGTEITYIQIPNNISNIGNYLFYNASAITTLIIPNGVISIGDNAFYGCESLTDISINSNSIMSNTYSPTSNFSTIFGSQVRTYTIETEINKIGDYTFYDCNEMSSILIPNNIKSIGNYAFYGCKKLASIKIPYELNCIGEYAFSECRVLNNVSLSEKLSSIGNYAFYGSKVTSLLLLAQGCYNELTFKGLDKSSTIYTYSTEIPTIKKNFSGTIIALDKDVYTTAVNNLYFKGFDFVVKNNAYNSMTHKIINITINDQPISPNENGVYEVRDLNYNTNYDVVLNYENTINVNGETHIIKGKHKETIKTKDLYISSSNVSYTSTQTSFTIDGINAPYDKTIIWQKVGFIYDGIEYDLGTQITGLEPLTSYQQYDSQSIYTGKYPVTVFADYNDGTHISQDIIVYTKHMTPTINVDTSYPTKLHIVGNDGAGDAKISETKIVCNDHTVYGNSTWLTNLVPNSYITVYYYVTTTGGTEDKTYATFKTPNVNFTTLPGKAVKAGEVIVAAKTNLPDEEVNVGFEWRKTDAPDDLPSSNGPGALYEGMLEAKIKNLSVTSYYRVRPYYEDANNKLYYGDWIAFDPSDFSYCEPTVHTYASAILKNNTATLTGYALSGSDDVIEQGFEYWTNSVAYAKSKGSTTNEYIQKIVANGQRMTATIDNLLAGTTYSYRAYLTTARGTTYGEEQTFTTSTVDGIVDIEAEQLKDRRTSKGVYTLSGLKVCDDVVDLKTLPRGIYIINGKKVVVK